MQKTGKKKSKKSKSYSVVNSGAPTVRPAMTKMPTEDPSGGGYTPQEPAANQPGETPSP